MELVIFPADPEGAKGNALVEALLSKGLTEGCSIASLGVGGEYEGDEVERVRSSKFGPSIYCQSCCIFVSKRA